jgi:phosphopantothenoylcysteine decarboxylase/phosphopantothenate--cysteine ligase
MKRVLILSGPTREYIDPVRYISNASSGKMGKALADEAKTRGLTIDFVSGPVSSANLPDGVRLHPVTTACEMLETARQLLPAADLIIFAAAVSDYMPATVSAEKLPKYTDAFSLKMAPTPDIAKTICAEKKAEQIAIGFALQTDDGPMKAREKLLRKGLNGIVLNDPSSLDAADGNFSFLSAKSTDFESWGRISKPDCAKHIFEEAQRIS